MAIKGGVGSKKCRIYGRRAERKASYRKVRHAVKLTLRKGGE